MGTSVLISKTIIVGKAEAIVIAFGKLAGSGRLTFLIAYEGAVHPACII